MSSRAITESPSRTEAAAARAGVGGAVSNRSTTESPVDIVMINEQNRQKWYHVPLGE